MTKKERMEKEKILDYYYSIQNQVNEAELVELKDMIKTLERELNEKDCK